MKNWTARIQAIAPNLWETATLAPGEIEEKYPSFIPITLGNERVRSRIIGTRYLSPSRSRANARSQRDVTWADAIGVNPYRV